MGEDDFTDGGRRKLPALPGRCRMRIKVGLGWRNPQTGEPIILAARRVLTFKECQVLKLALNPRKDGRATAVGE